MIRMEETISLEEIFKLLRKKIILILSMAFIGLGISALVTFFLMTPKYSASAQLITTVKTTDNNVNMDSLNSNLLMINTYKDLVKGQVVVDKVSKELNETNGLNLDAEEIREMVSVEQNQSSQMFSVTATSTKPKEASLVANTLSGVLQIEAANVTDTDKISIVSEAKVPTRPVSPNTKINLAIGLVLGLIIGILVALLGELFNRSVKSEEYILEEVGIPILGIIPILDDKEMKKAKKQQYAAMDSGVFQMEEEDFMFSADEAIDGLDEDLDTLDVFVNEKSIDEPTEPISRPRRFR